MLSLLAGMAMLGAAAALLYPFIPEKGVIPNRGDAADVMIAMTLTVLLAMGLALVVMGVATIIG